MMFTANARPAIPVVDCEEPVRWSPGPVFVALERALDLADVDWCEPGLRRRLRRNRRRVVSCCVRELRWGAGELMNEWRAQAAARQDYGGPDPLLQMLLIRVLLLSVECLATWTLTWGLPRPNLSRQIVLELRSALLAPSLSAAA